MKGHHWDPSRSECYMKMLLLITTFQWQCKWQKIMRMFTQKTNGDWHFKVYQNSIGNRQSSYSSRPGSLLLLPCLLTYFKGFLLQILTMSSFAPVNETNPFASYLAPRLTPKTTFLGGHLDLSNPYVHPNNSLAVDFYTDPLCNTWHGFLRVINRHVGKVMML